MWFGTVMPPENNPGKMIARCSDYPQEHLVVDVPLGCGRGIYSNEIQEWDVEYRTTWGIYGLCKECQEKWETSSSAS